MTTVQDLRPPQPGTQVELARAGVKCWADDGGIRVSLTAVRPSCDRLATHRLGLCSLHAEEILG